MTLDQVIGIAGQLPVVVIFVWFVLQVMHRMDRKDDAYQVILREISTTLQLISKRLDEHDKNSLAAMHEVMRKNPRARGPKTESPKGD